MRCIESSSLARPQQAQWSGLLALAAVAALAAGCASQPPASAPTPAAATPTAPRPVPVPAAPRPAPLAVPAPAPAPAAAPVPARGSPPLPDLGPRVAQPAAARVANWNDFKRMAARRMVAGSPSASYMGKPQAMLYAIPVLEVELNADGTVRDISVTRAPAKDDAQDTIDIAKSAIRRGEPYGDVSRLPKPWKFTEVFLFNDQRKFKPRTLD